MKQQESLNKLKDYAKFNPGGNNSYVAKKDGVTITIHTTGKVQFQGKDNKAKIEREVNKILNEILAEEKICENNKQLFVVYGHDKTAKEQLENILEKFNIQTNQITNNTGMTIIEALEKEISCVHAGIILLTPDDICVSKKDYEEHKGKIDEYIHTRARQNVILEMGMIMAKLGRDKTIILVKEKVEIPSDIHGVFIIPFKKNLKEEALTQLVKRLQGCGFVIDKDIAFDMLP